MIQLSIFLLIFANDVVSPHNNESITTNHRTMRKLLLLILTLFIANLAVMADRVSEAEALQKAQQYMQGKKFKMDGKRRAISPQQQQPAYYVFNAESDGGFVIVAGDDRMPDILGYSEKGMLNPETASCNVKWLLSYYDKVASHLTDKDIEKKSTRRAVLPSINPLITTTWDQGYPYNELCPIYEGERCITGCVATALAQVINYNRWPQDYTSSVPAYTTESLKIKMPELEPTIFNWDNMTNDDIARLMLYCGQAVQMDYGPSVSGAMSYMEAVALTSVFGYSQTTHQVNRDSYNEEEWEALLHYELAEGRPIVYNGDGTGGGHCFILHGYDNGLFYVNWGWSGNEDGYFRLTGLDTGMGDFNSGHIAIIGIQSPTGNLPDRPKVIVKGVEYWGNRYVSRDANGVFTNQVNVQLISDLSETSTLKIGLGLYDNAGLKQVLCEETHTFVAGEEYVMNATFTIDSNVADGVYRVVPISRVSDSDSWMADANSSDYYLEVKIDGQWMRLRAFQLNTEERNIEDLCVITDEGITYALYHQHGKARASILGFEGGKPKGDVYVPSQVAYNGNTYYISKTEPDVFLNCVNLTSLSIATTTFTGLVNCPMLTTLELREGVCRLNNAIEYCPKLTQIVFPKTLTTIENSISSCENLESIRFTNTHSTTFMFYPQWDSNSLPKLKDVYFASPDAATVYFKNGEFTVNAQTTIHVPEDAKQAYVVAGWEGWTIVEDQPVPSSQGIEWGYCNGYQVSDALVYDDCGNNDGEYAIHVPAEQLAPYQGMTISHIQFYQPTIACDYVFITKPGTDYLVKQTAPVLEGAWMDVELSQPYIITGDELYVGVGGRGTIATYFSNIEIKAPDGFWHRAMGSDTSSGMEPGVWKYVPDQNFEFERPIPLRFIISGEEKPADIAIQDICIKKSADEADRYTVQMSVNNRSQATVTSFVFAWDIDGEIQGTKTFEMNLRSGCSSIVETDIIATFATRYHKLNYSVTDVNGSTDYIAANSTGVLPFASSDTPIDDGTQIVNNVELKEGQLWWKNYDEEQLWNGGATMFGNRMLNQRYSAATFIPYNLVGGQGTTIDGFCFPRNSLAIKNVTIWISTHLPQSDIGADIEILDIPNNQLASEIFRDHQVAFKQSHEIPEGGLYVGYSFDIMDDMMNAGYPIECTSTEKNREGAFWVKNNYMGNWADFNPEYGNLKVQVLFGGGNYIQDAVRILDFASSSAVLGGKSQTEVMLINDGSDRVNNISYKVTGKNGNTYEKNAEVSIAAFDKNVVVLELDADPTQGCDEKTITITKVNGVANTASKGVEAKGTFYTLINKPVATAVVEELVSTTGGRCPAWMTVTDRLQALYGNQVLPIAIHCYDALEINEYRDIVMTNGNSVNRKKVFDDLYYGTLEKKEYGGNIWWQSSPFGIAKDVRQAVDAIVPGSVNVSVSWADEEHNILDINAETRFEMDADNIPYQLGFVLMEDGLSGSGSLWSMENMFADGNYYDDPMFDKWTGMPRFIENVKYENVPVAAWSPYKGIEGSVPETVKAGESNFYNFKANISGNRLIQNKENLSVVALLVDKNTGRIINASKYSFIPPVKIVANSYTREYGEDNPTFEYTTEGAELIGTPELICEATKNSPVGTYPIIVTKGTVENHNVIYVAGTLTIIASQTGIEEIMSNANGGVMIFTIDGKRVDNLKKGLNIVKLSDGTTRKVVVK